MELQLLNAVDGASCEIEHAVQTPSQIVIDPDAASFVARRGFQSDFDKVLQRLDGAFAPEKITVELIPGDDDGAETYSLAFRLKCDVDHETFQAQCDSFFEPLRISKPPIYFLIGVLRDL